MTAQEVTKDENIVEVDASTEKVVEQTKEEQPETTVEIARVDEIADEPEKEKAVEDTKEEEDSSLKADDKDEDEGSLTENMKKRLASNADKFGTKANLWDITQERAKNNPELKLLLIKELEDAGAMPKGSYDFAKSSFEKPAEENKSESEKVESTTEKTLSPEQAFVKQLFEEKQRKDRAEELRRFNTLVEFEQKHPDIGEREDAEEVRGTIAVLEARFKKEGKSETEALEMAYDTLFNREKLLERERNKGKVEGEIKETIKSIASAQSGSSAAPQSSVRKLTRDEEEARIMLGMTPEAYLENLEAMQIIED